MSQEQPLSSEVVLMDKKEEKVEEQAEKKELESEPKELAEDQKEEKTPQGRGVNPDLLDPNKPIWKPVFFFLIPLMLSNALQSLGQTVSTVILGKGIGENSLAAASSIFPIVFFLTSFVIGIGSASSILIGQAFGAGQKERIKQTVNTSLKFSFVLGVFLAIIGVTFVRDLIILIGTPPAIMEEAVLFGRIIFASLPIQFIYINYTTFLRGTGDSKTPFYFLMISTLLSILFTPVLAFGYLGFPQLGIRGVGYASIAALSISLLTLIVYLKKKQHILAVQSSLFSLRFHREILKLLLKIGLPTSVQMVFVSLSEVAVIFLINGYGEKATAAYGAVMQVITYAQIPAMSLGIAAGVFGAQLIGARATQRLKSLLVSSVVLNYLLGIVLIGTIYLCSGVILSWFLTEPSTREMAQQILYIMLWSYMLFGNGMVLGGLMRSSGVVLWPTLITIFTIWGVQVPVAYVLAKTMGFGLNGVWAAYPIAFTFLALAFYIYYRFFWSKKSHQILFHK